MAIILKNKNFAKSSLASDIAIDATQLTVSAGTGSLFPSSGTFRAVIYSAAASNPLSDLSREIIDMSLSAGDTFNIVRSKENTSAKAWSSGDNIAHIITAGKIDEIEGEVNLKMNADIASFSAITSVADNDLLAVVDTSESILKKISVKQIQEASVSASMAVSSVSITGLTAGSVLFAGAGAAISQDNSNLFWDNSNKRLGIGATSPVAKVQIGGNLASSNGFSACNASQDVDILLGKDGSNYGAATWVNGSAVLSFWTRAAATSYNNTLVLKDGNVGINTASPTISDGNGLHIAGKILRIATSKAPESASATGNAGEICWASGYLYVCINTNTWRRVGLSSWTGT